MKLRILAIISFGVILLMACGVPKPEPIALNKDNCNSCKMTIADPRFACEVITKKGRVLKFDDVFCLKGYLKNIDESTIATMVIADFAGSHQLQNTKDCFYVKFESINSPMQGNTIAFANKDSAHSYATLHNTTVLNWADVVK